MNMGSGHVEMLVSSANHSLDTNPQSDSQLAPEAVALQQPVRDRIVILGRRRSGKTIFLARLYEQLWKSTGHFHMRALSGDTHKACMEVVQELELGQWPASTLGAQYSDIEITYRGEKHLLVALDYPGEVFRKAFVDNSDAEDARELLDHVDRAAAVILLLDPGVAEGGALMDIMDDDYGMVQAVHRIREWPGGETVPLVIVFTKSDMHKATLVKHGGLKSFALKRYPSLVRAVNRFKVFASTAVRSRSEGSSTGSPDVTQPPVGVIEPIEYCLQKIIERRNALEAAEAAEARKAAYIRQLEESHQARRRSILFWSVFWSVALAAMACAAIITWMVVNKEL